jgi:hypothetical protein
MLTRVCGLLCVPCTARAPPAGLVPPLGVAPVAHTARSLGGTTAPPHSPPHFCPDHHCRLYYFTYLQMGVLDMMS